MKKRNSFTTSELYASVKIAAEDKRQKRIKKKFDKLSPAQQAEVLKQKKEREAKDEAA
jgi:hypothetical protein